MENIQTKKYLQIASLMMALGVAIGAFGAHGLAPYLDEYGNIIYNKGISYWFYNSLGLFGIAFTGFLLKNNFRIKIGFYLVLFGTLIFSISLFILALTHIKWLGAITPIGGTAMIVGWLFIMWAIFQERNV